MCSGSTPFKFTLLPRGELKMEFNGPNSFFLEQYIEFKRNLGYSLKKPYIFEMFDRFTIENNVTTIGLTKKLADKWSQQHPNESDVTRYKRVNDIINFSIYLNHLGYQSYIPRRLKSYQSTFTPYIFSQEELKSFFTACDTIKVHQISAMRYVLPIIFRMIYSCGLRANEALSLKCRDVNLEDKYIIIREPKNGRDRILPLSDSMTNACILYRKHYLSAHNNEDYYFCQNNGHRYETVTLYKWFRRIIWKAGIQHGGRGIGPRVQDLRHSFSVHSLAEMSRKGLDLYYSLPILSSYLGHQSLEATDKYVRLTSDMFPELIREVNNLCSYVFPEVKLP